MDSTADPARPGAPREGPDQQFWDLADVLIRTANEQCDTASRTKVSAAMLFAAARFNTFVVAAAASSGDDLAARRDEIVRYLTDQYQAMLRDNLDEYARNFSRYVPPSAS